MFAKPLLAATLEDPMRLPFPVLVSAKLDGIRALKVNGQVVSRNLKPIRNKYIQHMLRALPEGCDGELIVGPPNEGLVFNRTSSGVMSAEGEPDFTFCIFDNFNIPGSFAVRFTKLLNELEHPRAIVVPHYKVDTPDELFKLEEAMLQDNYEGLMVRGPGGRYKQGRATHSDRILWKFKRFRDGEAVVLKVVEGVTNRNVAIRNELGYLERSTHQENMQPSGKVGTLICQDCTTNELINISPGRMDHVDRTEFLAHPERIVGRIAKYKVFDYGKVYTSRFCTFQGFRDPADMGT